MKRRPSPLLEIRRFALASVVVLAAMPVAGGRVTLTPSASTAPAGVAQTTRVSTLSDGTQAYGGSSNPSVSGDGRWVAFTSDSPNFSGHAGFPDPVLLRDNVTGQIISVGFGPSNVAPRPRITADGRYVFGSYDISLRNVLVYDRTTGRTVQIPSRSPTGGPFYTISDVAVTDDLHYAVGFGNASGCFAALYLVDLVTGQSAPIVAFAGSPLMSPTGRDVADICLPKGENSFKVGLLDLRNLSNTRQTLQYLGPGFAERFTTDNRYLLISTSVDGSGFGDGITVYDLDANQRSFERTTCATQPSISP